MPRKKILYAALFALVAVACRNGGSNTEPKAATRDFPEIAVPSLMADRLSADEYTLLHFWDAFADSSGTWLCDSLHSNGVSISSLEEEFAVFATLAQNLQDYGSVAVQKAMQNMIRNMDICQQADSTSNVFGTLAGLAQKYFYDPNSPCRDEDIYLPIIQHLATSPYVDGAMRCAYEFDHKMCSLNVKGTTAADFTFTEASGRRRSLHDIKADYILLMFSNPGCPNCAEVMEQLTTSRPLKDIMEKGCRLEIVNIYIDQEIDNWKDYVHNYPSSWICGYDHNYIIRTDLLYNVRAIPSLYLLSGDMTVIMKDATPERIIRYLYTKNS